MAALRPHRAAAARRPALLSSRILLFLAIGFLLGCSIGYLLMGTAHSILQTRGTAHYGHAGGQALQQQQRQQQGQRAGGSGMQRDSHAAAAGTAAAAAAAAATAAAAAGSQPPQGTIHTLCTGNGSPYQNYQLRIAYATYRLVQKMPSGERHVAFTRILHRTQPDHAQLMAEIETFRADPLQPACDTWCEYPVSDRANAVRQFFDAAERNASMIRGEWIYMVESDYVFMKPLPLPIPQQQAEYQAWGYPFDYIKPSLFPEAMAKLYAGPASAIPGTGPAPLLMRAEDWKRVTPDWEQLTEMVERDPELVKQLGWVREMYAFSVALTVTNIKVELLPAGESVFIAQLPIDDSLGKAHAFHYTQCTIWKSLADNKDVWAYDKRFHTSLEDSLRVPAIETAPPFQEGKWKTIEGKPISAGLHAAVEALVAQMNAGIATLKPLAARR